MNKSKLTDWQKKDATRYKVIATGKKIKAVNVAHGTYEDIKTGQRYMFDEIEYLGERRHMVQLGFHIWRVNSHSFPVAVFPFVVVFKAKYIYISCIMRRLRECSTG